MYRNAHENVITMAIQRFNISTQLLVPLCLYCGISADSAYVKLTRRNTQEDSSLFVAVRMMHLAPSGKVKTYEPKCTICKKRVQSRCAYALLFHDNESRFKTVGLEKGMQKIRECSTHSLVCISVRV